MVSNTSQPKISPTVCENSKFLCAVARTKSEGKRKKLLKNASEKELLSIIEICLNIVKSRFKLTARQKRRLLPYANIVRKISRARTEKSVRKIVVQKGNGIGVFAAILTPVLLELARNLIKGE